MNKQGVLFLCTHNSARSQMAEGFSRAKADARFAARSAGTEHIRALLRVCNVHTVPLATNVATADLIITAFARIEELQPADVIP